jgi:prepilin-type N-terminal cleavage/methylation domain-containing protein
MRRAQCRGEAGVTLIELLIAITLVALLSTAMLMGLRAGFLSYRRTTDRMQDNRRTSNIEAILARQIAGVIPAMGGCATSGGGIAPVPFFNGTPTSMRLISSYSMSEGARGLPRVIELQVVPNESGGVRLVVNEHLYTGLASTAPFCFDGRWLPVTPNAQSFVAADGLAYCRFQYREAIPDSVLPGNWLPVWSKANLPNAVRIDMAPLQTGPGRLAFLPVTVPIHVTREVVAQYTDDQ